MSTYDLSLVSTFFSFLFPAVINYQVVSFWLALDNVSLENGGMKMVNFTGLPNVSINKQAGDELCLAQFNIQCFGL